MNSLMVHPVSVTGFVLQTSVIHIGSHEVPLYKGLHSYFSCVLLCFSFCFCSVGGRMPPHSAFNLLTFPLYILVLFYLKSVNQESVTTKTKQLLRTTEMNTLRAILGKTRFDGTKNIDILERCNLQEVVKFVKSRRKAWNEQVSRAEQRLIKLVRDARPNTQPPPGRPPKRWADSWQSSFTGTP